MGSLGSAVSRRSIWFVLCGLLAVGAVLALTGTGIRAEVAAEGMVVKASVPKDTTVTVSNVHAQQYGSFVRVVYDLEVTPSGPVAVSIAASTDGGITFDVAASSVYGAVGASVQPGAGKIAVWNVYADLAEQQVAESAIRIVTVPAAGAGGVPRSNVFVVDARLVSLDANGDGVPDDIFDLDQDGTPDAAEDFNGNGIPDAFEDTDANGVPDAYQDLNSNGVPDGFEDADGDGTPDWFAARLPLYSPTHPDSAKWYFSPTVTVNYPNYMAGTPLYGYLWVMDQSSTTAIDNGGTFRAAADPKTVQATPTASGHWYFHIAALATNHQIIDGSQRNFQANVYIDSLLVSSATHPYTSTPYFGKTFAAALALVPREVAGTQVTAAAEWSGRADHTSVVFHDNIWVLGGFDYNRAFDDVWYSSDGAHWTQTPWAVPWPARYGHSSVVFDDKIWVLGGYNSGSRYMNDVWYSSDGVIWTQAIPSDLIWSARREHASVVFDSKIWVLGGLDAGGIVNDAWYTPDGVHWSLATGAAAWSPRYRHTSVVFDNKIWVLGGMTAQSQQNDVWSSPDGVDWTQVVPSGPMWGSRFDHTSVVFADKIWVLGGSSNSSGIYKDIWGSPDGVRWSLATGAAAWGGRSRQTSVAFGNRVWILGGYDSANQFMNDVWSCWPFLLQSDTLGYYWWIDGDAETFSAGTEIARACNAPGTHVFHAVGVDSMGTRSAQADYQFIVGEAAPELSSPTHPDPDVPIVGTAVTLDWDANGVPNVVKYWYVWGTTRGAMPTTETTDVSITFNCVDPSVYWFAIQSEDACGFKSPVAERKVTVGFAPAGPEVFSPTHPYGYAAYAARDVQFTWIAESGSGAPYYYIWDQIPYSVPAMSSSSTSDAALSETNVAPGRYFLHLCATDGCGHLSPATHFAVRVREARPPQVVAAGWSTRSYMGFSWTDPDGLSALPSYRYYLALDQDASTIVTTASPDHTDSNIWSEFNKPDGIYYFHIRSKDAYGNLSVQGDTMVVVGDAMVGLSPPSSTLTTSEPVGYLVSYPSASSISLAPSDITLNKTGTADAGRVSVRTILGDLQSRWVWISDITGDGTLSISLAAGTATYPGGKVAPAVGPSGAFAVDNSPPHLEVSGPVPPATTQGPATYMFTYTGATDVLLSQNDVTLFADPVGAAGATVELAGDGLTTRTVTLTNCWGNGRLHIEIAAGTASDAAGGLANAAVSAAVTMDNVAPTGGITINGGALWTRAGDVNLALVYGDGNGSGVAQMRFSNDGSDWSAYENVGAAKAWTLSPGDGAKTVYVQFKDAAGNESSLASDTINLDTTPPSGTVVINGGAAFTNDPSVTLTLTSGDGAGSGVAQMRFSNDASSWSAWEAAAASKAWNLSAGDGAKTVYVQFNDVAGNVGNATGAISLDTTAPSGSVVIDDNAQFTSSANVTLTLAASDGAGSGVTHMRLSNDGSVWLDWEAFAASKAWSLPAGDGVKTVSVQFKDALGNTSGTFSASTTLDTTAPTGAIAINGGASYTGTPAVTLTLTAGDGANGSGVTQMRLREGGGAWDAWEPFAATASWTLQDGDGAKTVFAQFQDLVGNISAVYSADITLDTTPPTGTVVINANAAFTGSRDVTLTLTGVDGAGSGVSKMRFSGNNSDWSAWETFSASKAWSLPAGDGPKTVYVQFQDAVGNGSASFSDEIALDTTPPTGTIVINANAAFTGNRGVALTLTAEDDAGSGVAQMRFSNDGTNWSAWEPFAASKAWSLLAGDGSKTVYAQFQDAVGNGSVSFSDDIALDTTPPTGTVLVNADAAFTNSRDVTLTLTADDGAGSGVAQMRFSNDNSDWSAWEPFAASKAWSLSAGDGLKTVYVQLLDAVGNRSVSIADEIALDATPPSGTVAVNGGADFTNSRDVTLTLTADDGAGAGVAQMRFSNDAADWSPWEAFAGSKAWTLTTGDGAKTVYAQFKDVADNVSANATDMIALDTAVPTGTVVINANAVLTNSRDVTLTLTADDGAGSGVSKMRFSDNNSDWSAWEPFATSKTWSLPVGDGSKTVFAQFQDAVGNGSASFSDEITLDSTLPTGTVVIDGGADFTNSRDVTLTLTADDGAGSGVSQMRLSNDGADWSSWEAFAGSKAWTITTGDGAKTVYAQFKDVAENVSANFTDTIALDATPPTGTILINANAAFTNSRDVTLTLTADDGAGSGAAQMRFSDEGANWSAWEAFSASKAWSLPAGNGVKTVHAQYKDAVGNVSSSVSDDITLDVTPPTGSVVINASAAFTSSRDVILTLSADDGGGSGVGEMRFSDDGTNWSAWEAFSASKAWPLPEGDGAKTVHVQFRDRALNVSISVSDDIGLDTTAPAGNVAINAGAAFTNSADVTLALTATDAPNGSGLAQMCFSNDAANWSNWEAFAASKAWTTTEGDGTKTVSVQFKDVAGNVSQTANATIYLDTTGPVGTATLNGGAVFANSLDVTLALICDDGAGSGVAEMRFRDDGGAWRNWETFAASRPYVLPAGDGAKTVYVQFRDRVGNVSQVVSDDIVLDTTRPIGTVAVQGGASYATARDVALTLTASDGTGSGVAQMRLSNDGTAWGDWKPFAASTTWTLPAGDGPKTVFAQFMDNALNVSQSVMAGVTLDTTAPIGTVAIPGAIMFQGVAYTNSADVSLALSASDGSGAGLDAMRVSNDGSNWAPWEPFAANRAWPLNPGDGVKTVYVEYRDTVGNFSTPVTANITLRTTAPDVALTTPALRVAGPFVVTAAFTDPVAEFDAGDATVTNGTISGFGGSGNTYQWTVTPVSDQPVSVFVAADACVGPVNLWNTASNTLELTIDHPPAAEGQDVSTFRDTPVAITLVGADLDGDPLTYRIVTGPAHGALEGAGPSFTYTPATGYVGADSFAYVTHDGIADSAPATVTITILPPPVGSLTMNVEPEYARTANATWQVDGGDSHASGETVSDLPVGDHVVSFSDIPAQDTGGCFGSTVTYVTPADLHVTVSLNQTTTITATYEKETKSLAATAPSGSQLGDLLILGCAAATLGGLTSKRKKRGSV